MHIIARPAHSCCTLTICRLTARRSRTIGWSLRRRRNSRLAAQIRASVKGERSDRLKSCDLEFLHQSLCLKPSTTSLVMVMAPVKSWTDASHSYRRPFWRKLGPGARLRTEVQVAHVISRKLACLLPLLALWEGAAGYECRLLWLLQLAHLGDVLSV